MSNFFYRSVSQDVEQGIRSRRQKLRLDDANKSFVDISIEAGQLSYKDDGTIASIGNYTKVLPVTIKSSGNPPMLKDVKVTIDGDYMTLKRAEFNFSVMRNDAAFMELDRQLLYPGAPIKIKWKSIIRSRTTNQPLTTSIESGEFIGQVYDYSFTIKPGGEYEASVKAVGKGNELMEANAADTSMISGQLSVSGGPLKYVTNYEAGEADGPDTGRTAEVRTIFDYMDYDIQRAFGKLEAGDFDVEPGSSQFGKPSEYGLDYTHAGFGIIAINNDWYKNKVMIETDAWNTQRVPYVTLQYVTWLVNKFVKPRSEVSPERYQIVCDDRTTRGNLEYTLAGGDRHYLISSDPLQIGIVTGNIITRQSYVPTEIGAYGSVSQGYTKTEVLIDDCYGPLTRALDRNTICFSHRPFDSGYDLGLKDSEVINVRNGNLSGILINRDVLRNIERKYMNDQHKDKLTVEMLFKEIFDIIRACTAGAVDLFLLNDPDNEDPSIVRYLVVNGKEPSEPALKRRVLEFSENDHIVFKYGLNAKVPKDVAAAAFGGAPSSNGDALTQADAIRGNEAAMQNSSPSYPAVDDIVSAKNDMAQKEFDSSTISALQAILKSMISDESGDDKIKRKTITFPIEMDLELNGLSGLKFGDAITFSEQKLPARYTSAISGNRLVFTIHRIEHVFGSGGGTRDWRTRISALCRLVPADSISIVKTKDLN